MLDEGPAVIEIPPSWTPDLFAWLFQRVEAAQQRVVAEALVEHCYGEQRSKVDEIRNLIREAPDGNSPKEVRDFLATQLRGGARADPLTRDLIVLLAIDDTFAEMKLGCPGSAA